MLVSPAVFETADVPCRHGLLRVTTGHTRPYLEASGSGYTRS